jgi:hypothetical protein
VTIPSVLSKTINRLWIVRGITRLSKKSQASRTVFPFMEETLRFAAIKFTDSNFIWDVAHPLAVEPNAKLPQMSARRRQ